MKIKIIAALLVIMFMIAGAAATISDTAIVTNYGKNTAQAPIETSPIVNVTFNDTLDGYVSINWIKLQFPRTFSISSILASDITTGMGSIDRIVRNYGDWSIRAYNFTGTSSNPGVVLDLPFDETTGTNIYGATQNPDTCLWSGSGSPNRSVSIYSNNAITLNGTDKITCNHKSDYNFDGDDLTLTFWINIPASERTNTTPIIQKRSSNISGYEVALNSSNYLIGLGTVNFGTMGAGLANNTNYKVDIVKGSGNATLYINGTQNVTANNTIYANSSNALYFNYDAINTSFNLTPNTITLDEFELLNRAKTQAQITQDFNNPNRLISWIKVAGNLTTTSSVVNNSINVSTDRSQSAVTAYLNTVNAITGTSVVTGTGLAVNTTTAIAGTNVSLNVSFNESTISSANMTTITLTFPTGFTINGVITGDVTSSMGVSDSISSTSTSITVTNTTGTSSNSTTPWMKINANVTIPSTAGSYGITVTTSRATTGADATMYVVDDTIQSSIGLVTNLTMDGIVSGTSARVFKGTNSTLNITFTDTTPYDDNLTWINLTIPSTFSFGALSNTTDITTNLGANVVYASGATFINISNSSGALSTNESAVYVYLSGNITMPSTAGDYGISIKTNRMSTTDTVYNATVYVRDSTKPFLVYANNSNYVIASEAFTSITETAITLTGTGITKLTYYAPNITGETNITMGYGVLTNATSVEPIQNATWITVHVVTESGVTNPIITLQKVTNLKSSNIPKTIIAAGAAILALISYVVRRRRKR